MTEDTTNILTIKINRNNINETIGLFSNWIERSEKKRVCVTPVNCVLWARKNETLKKIYNTSDMTLADGIPLIWASKILDKPIRGRVTGLDLLPQFAEIAVHNGYTFYFLGAKEGVAEDLKRKLIELYPNIKIVGTYSPPFAARFSDEENNKIIHLINEVKPNVLWVSLTAPKQDYWIYENIGKLNVNIAIGVGGAFEVTAGLIKRAPKWMQENGLEWLFRFLQEPKRLFRRYFIEAPLFIPLIILQKFGLLKD